MHKKISVGLTVTIAIFSIIVTALITTAVTMSIFSTLVSDLPEREAMYSSLSQIDDIVRNEYYGEIDDTAVNYAIVDSYLEKLESGQNKIMTKDEYSEYKEKQSGAATTVSFKKYSNIGYIQITDFTDTTPAEFTNAYDSLKANSVKGIIIDVRDTDSINIKASSLIIDKIVPLATEGTQAIATAVDKNNSNIAVFPADSDSIDIPVSVIVNEKTSGAGELLACDIRDFGKGTIVGKQTAGNGSYQKIFELSDGRAIVLTVAKLLPYKSDCYDGTGVIPDYDAQLKEKTDDLNKDTQFMQAYASVTALQK